MFDAYATPEMYFERVLRAQLWEGQRRVLRALIQHRWVAVGSGHALGKDFIGGGLPLWFNHTHYPSKVILTAPTDRQVESIMWAELSTHYERGGGKKIMGGKLTVKNLSFDEDWFTTAFTTKETKGQTGKFQGYHSPNILVIVSEAQAVDDTIFEQIEAVMTSKNSYLLLLGNPLRSSGYYARSLRARSEFHVVNLNCMDNPNYIQRKEVIPGLATYEWVEKMRKKYGDDSPIWQGRVLGQVPDSSIDNVIFFADAEAAIERRLILPITDRRVLITNDPATFGDDECFTYVQEEGKFSMDADHSILAKKPTTEIAGHLIVLRKKTDADGIAVDTIGEGRGVADNLNDARETVIEFKGSNEALDKKQFQNQRAEAWWYAREQFAKGRVSIPDDPILLEELTEVKYFINRRGLIQIEDKEDIKERIGRSPNRADALVQGLWVMRDLQKKPKEKPSDEYRDSSSEYESATSAMMA